MIKSGRRKGFTRIELISVIIIIMVFIAIIIPVLLHFLETENQARDRLEATKAEDLVRLEYMMTHYPDGGEIVYYLTGESEAQKVLYHFPYESETPEEVKIPRSDYYKDGGAAGKGEPAKGNSKRVGDRELYVIIGGDGEIIYDSWLEILNDEKTSAFNWKIW